MKKIKVSVRGDEQIVLISGKDSHKPVMLFLHGGPGISNIGLCHKVHGPLYDSVNVVEWDQRASGLSAKWFYDYESLSIQTYVDDTLFMIDWVLREFNKEKLILVGHSWGTILGVKAAAVCPEKIAHFVGVSPILRPLQIENDTINFTIEKCSEQGWEKERRYYSAILEMNLKLDNPFNYIKRQRKFLTKLGGIVYGHNSFKRIILDNLKSNHYGIYQFLKMIFRSKKLTNNIWNELMKLDTTSDYQSLKVPTTILIGSHDKVLFSKGYHDVSLLSNNHNIKLNYSKKAAHYPHYSDTKTYNDIILN